MNSKTLMFLSRFVFICLISAVPFDVFCQSLDTSNSWFMADIKRRTLEQRIIEPIPPPDPGSRVYVSNNCRFPVQVALRYMNTSGNWVTRGWWNIGPNLTTFLTHDGEYISSNNTIFYYYAETTNTPKSLFWHGKHQINFSGRILHMREFSVIKDSNGNFNLPLNCEGF